MCASAVEPISAALLSRGVCRAFEQLGYVSLVEFPLANGRRADILALGRTGDLVIVEIKSSVADFRADRKWNTYRDFSDRLYFAVPNDFPRALIPDECGLMVADSFGAHGASRRRHNPDRGRAPPCLDGALCPGGCGAAPPSSRSRSGTIGLTLTPISWPSALSWLSCCNRARLWRAAPRRRFA